MNKLIYFILGIFLYESFISELSASNIMDKNEIWMLEQMLLTPMDEVLTISLEPDDFVEPYTQMLLENDIYLSLPKEFFLSDSLYTAPFLFVPNPKHLSQYYTTNGIGKYTPPFYSKGKDALLIFPLKIESVTADFLVQDEFMAAYDNIDIDCSDLVKNIENKDIRKSCNIDRLYYYEYDIMSENEYKHCIGMVLRKENHPALTIKLLLTDNGLKNKDEYISNALDCIRYGDKSLKEYELEEQILKNVRAEFKFPLKRISNTGITMERPKTELTLPYYKLHRKSQ